MISFVTASLKVLAQKYVWWEDPDVATKRPAVLLCQLMQLGTYDDVQVARQLFGDEAFKAALRQAPPGILDEKSWNFWHRLFAEVPIPPMPVRPLP